MSSFTKKAIIKYTIDLAEQKPLKKLTVNDIVKACGITRNTFYYYFHDMYDVLDQALTEQVMKLKGCPPEKYDKVLFEIIEYTVSYKKVWRNLYKTLGQEQLQKYVMNKVHVIFLEYIENQLNGEKISDEDLGIICAFFEEALFGVMARWVRGESTIGTPEEMQEFSNRIKIIFSGTIPLMLENIRKREQ